MKLLKYGEHRTILLNVKILVFSLMGNSNTKKRIVIIYLKKLFPLVWNYGINMIYSFGYIPISKIV